MSIRLHRVSLTGPSKDQATLDFRSRSHLVFGPTDTGKSYILHCLRYALGGGRKPPDIGLSEGYTRVAVQVVSDAGAPYSLIRDLATGEGVAYPGFHDLPPQGLQPSEDRTIPELLTALSGGSGRKILTKTGELQNFSAGDLRLVSLFDEIRTLNSIPLVGSDVLLKTRNRSAIALILTGVDDSGVVLAPSSKQRTLAKGQIEEIDAEIAALRARIAGQAPKADLMATMNRLTARIDELSRYLQTHTDELEKLKGERRQIESSLEDAARRQAALSEARGRFEMLDSKYESDLGRLRLITSAASLITAFAPTPCPLCHTPIEHQARHQMEDGNQHDETIRAAATEIRKIESLRMGLREALNDIDGDAAEARAEIATLRDSETKCLELQTSLLGPFQTLGDGGLADLTARRTELAFAIRDAERLDLLVSRRAQAAVRTKRSKQSITRDVSTSAGILCRRIKSLLDSWGIPGIDSIFFDEENSDVWINQRERSSFGKGKRAIFLTAYATALMEHALEKGHPHFGFVAIDSPVVTYRDPKHGRPDLDNELLDPSVTDLFYSWLARRSDLGQVVILENDEPNASVRERLSCTEFIGSAPGSGRRGFIPA